MSGPPKFGTAPALKLNSILEMKRVLDRKLSVDRKDVTAAALDLPLYAASVFLPSSLLFTRSWCLSSKRHLPEAGTTLQQRSKASPHKYRVTPPRVGMNSNCSHT